MFPQNTTKSTTIPLLAFFLLCSLFVGGFLVAIFCPNLLYTLHLVPVHDQYTELYFANYKTLPSTAIANTKQQFSFVIHNEEGKAMKYNYAVSITSGENAKQLAQGTSSLQDNAVVTISESFIFPNFDGKSVITVELSNPHESIHFLVTKGINSEAY